jgi:hypothetical protein
MPGEGESVERAKWKSDLRFGLLPITCMLIAGAATVLLSRSRNSMRPLAQLTPAPESKLQRILNSFRRSAPDCRTGQDWIAVSMKEYYRSAGSLVMQALHGKRVVVAGPSGPSSMMIGVPSLDPFREEDEEAMADVREAEQQLKERPAEAWLA